MPRIARLEGPVTAGSKGRPFGAAAFDLKTQGYVEAEFFLSGEAARFRPAPGTERRADGRWSVVEAGASPYRTRLLVRRPADPARFNGTVILLWNNVSLGFDILTGETAEMYRDGFALVALSAQRAGVHGFPEGPKRSLRDWDPERYGTLDLPDDEVGFDICSQAAFLVGRDRPKGSVDPLGGLPVQRVLAMGVSQSATRLATYLNAIQPLTNAVDGFLLDVYFGNGAALEEPKRAAPAIMRVEEINKLAKLMPPGSHRLRTDQRVPIFVMNSETEAELYAPVRQEDGERFRFWEAAGLAHGSAEPGVGLASNWERDLGITRHPLAPAAGTNALTLAPLRSAVLRHMQAWLAEGKAPPVQPRLAVAEGRLVRDELGIAKGGIRMPRVAVPTQRHSGKAADGEFSLFGSSTPFPPGTLQRLYPGVPAYEHAVDTAIQSAVASGVLLKEDAEAERRAALADFKPV